MADMDAILLASTDKKQDNVKKKEHYEKLLVDYMSENINSLACRVIIYWHTIRTMVCVKDYLIIIV